MSEAKGLSEPLNFITLLHEAYREVSILKFLHAWENVVFALIVSILVTAIFCWGAKNPSLVPSGLQNFLEALVEWLRTLIGDVLGPSGDKYLPLLGSIFIYILAMNFFGLIPLMKSPSSNLNITAAHALCVFLLVQYLNIKNLGIRGFFYHLAGSPKDAIGWCLSPLLFPIEILTQFARPITLAFRLFGNIFGEDILIGYFTLLGAMMIPALYPIGIPLQIPFIFLALLTSVMQALVFTLLTAVYILLSMPEAEESH